MNPIDLKIQNYYTQTGVEKNPVIMWKYGPGSKSQTAYEINLFQGEERIYTTGKIMSGEQNGIELPCQLAEQTQYEYQVRVWDENGQEYCSHKAKFITGVKNWRGSWIGNGTRKPFIAKKEFEVEAVGGSAGKDGTDSETGRAPKAILSLCVPGQYEVLLNGEKISPYVYEGCQTDFHKHVHYSTYDVTAFLKPGVNLLTVEVANGWYISDDDQGRRYHYTTDKGYKPYGECLAFLAQLKLAGGDCDTGSIENGNGDCGEIGSASGHICLVTDESWQISPSRTVLADIYGSEDMDYTREYEWTSARIVKGPRGQIIAFDYPPVVQKKCYTPQSVRQIDSKTVIYDFGQNMSSQFRIRIKGERGQLVKVIPAEKLAGSKSGVMTESYGQTESTVWVRDIEQTVPTYSILTLSGGEDIFEQKFSVNGARWYKLEGVEPAQVLEFQSYFVTSVAEKSGYFHCSDKRLNGIFHLIENAIDSNLNHSHTDCPTIEKLGWLEPNHLMGKAIMYLKDVDMMWSKIAMDMRDAQYGEGEFDVDNGAFPHEYKAGLVPSIAPRYARFITDWKEGSFWDIIPWGSSIILAAYEQYQFYGNTRILAKNYDSAKKYLDYLTVQYNDYNRLYGKSGEEKFICAGLGDWGIAPNKGRGRENIETAFYYHDLMIMAKIARILSVVGNENSQAGIDLADVNAFLTDAQVFENQAKQVRLSYNKALLVQKSDEQRGGTQSDGNYRQAAYYRAYDTDEITQTNQAIPLCFGLVPEEARGGVADTLIGLCEGEHLTCGEIGLVYILRALSQLGRNDIIFDMILKENHPSYLRFSEQGETTLPEFWRDDARSRNHDMMGHIMEWFFTEVAGIKGDVGFKNVHIAPGCKDLVESFSCVYDSIRGKIRVEYDGEKLTVETPGNVNVKIS